MSALRIDPDRLAVLADLCDIAEQAECEGREVTGDELRATMRRWIADYERLDNPPNSVQRRVAAIKHILKTVTPANDSALGRTGRKHAPRHVVELDDYRMSGPRAEVLDALDEYRRNGPKDPA